MTLNDVFDAYGNFHKQSYDPYRWQEEDREIHTFLFDEEDGHMTDALYCSSAVEDFIRDKEVSPFSDIVKFYWAQQHGLGTKGSYPAIYMWR